MKITIEDTRNITGHKAIATVEVVHDDLNIQEVAQLLRQVLLGYGYAKESVMDILPEDE